MIKLSYINITNDRYSKTAVIVNMMFSLTPPNPNFKTSEIVRSGTDSILNYFNVSEIISDDIYDLQEGNNDKII